MMHSKNTQESYYIGVKRNADGSLDFSKAAKWIQSGTEDAKKKYQDLLSSGQEVLVVPRQWTMLYHGSNLMRPQWQGEKRTTLDAPTLTINQGTGLSVISDAEKKKQETEKQNLREQGVPTPSGGTTESYAAVNSAESEPLEIQIAFPEIHDRLKGSEEVAALYREKYGAEPTKAMLDLCNTVFWKNHQSGRHPVLPRGIVLTKIHDMMRMDGVRVIQYIPKDLENMYRQEVADAEKNA